MSWATFWATFSKTHLVTLPEMQFREPTIAEIFLRRFSDGE
jgi:hypothetical protein